jgi:hypothetical protein
MIGAGAPNPNAETPKAVELAGTTVSDEVK